MEQAEVTTKSAHSCAQALPAFLRWRNEGDLYTHLPTGTQAFRLIASYLPPHRIVPI